MGASISYRELFELSPSAIVLEDAQGTIVDVNPALCRVMGYSRDELLGSNIRTFVPPGAVPAIDRHLAQILEGQTLFHVVTNLRKDGSVLHLELHERRVTLPSGEPGILVIANDVTERVKLEAQVYQAQKLESLGLMAGGIAHDFNNMLLAITGHLELALFDLPEDSPLRPCLIGASEAARHASDLSRQLLAFAGRGRFAAEPVELSQLLQSLDLVIRAAVPHKIDVTYALAEGLPMAAADASQLRQIIMNLVVNASEAIADRPGTIAIATTQRTCDGAAAAADWVQAPPEPGAYLELSVTDTGPGMPEDVLPRIFDPFYSTKFVGRGLGLPAVLGIVRGHHGALQVTSAPGQGTCIRILLPAIVSRRPPDTPPSPRPPAARPRKTVLMVDDEEQVRVVGKMMLERLEYDVILAGDGDEAVKLMRDKLDSLACVLLDLSMPSKDGIETLVELRAISPHVGVILTSGFAERDVLHRLQGARHNAFLQKPFTFRALEDTLLHVISPA